MKKLLQHRPWWRWTVSEQRLGEIMQQQAETVGKAKPPSEEGPAQDRPSGCDKT